MFIALVVFAIVLAGMLSMSASFKLRRHDQVVASIHGTVGVPLHLFPVLAGLELAAALGVLVGLWIAPLGIVAATGTALYFVGALVGHVRVGDTKGLGAPIPPLAIALVVIVLRVATA